MGCGDYLIIYFLLQIEELPFFFHFFFLLIAILIFLSAMTNNQTKCGIIYEKIVVWAAYDEQMINYEWPHGKTQK